MKYNRSEIMKRAWTLVKETAVSISEALKNAWKEAKDMLEKKVFGGYVKMVICGREHYSDSDSAKFASFKLWEKNGHKRIYMNDYKKRTVGYIDLKDNNRIVTDTRDTYYLDTISAFMNTYAF